MGAREAAERAAGLLRNKGMLDVHTTALGSSTVMVDFRVPAVEPWESRNSVGSSIHVTDDGVSSANMRFPVTSRGDLSHSNLQKALGGRPEWFPQIVPADGGTVRPHAVRKEGAGGDAQAVARDAVSIVRSYYG